MNTTLNNHLSVIVVRILFLALIIVLGIFAPLTLVAQITSLSFATYAILGLVLSLLGISVAAVLLFRHRRVPIQKDSAVLGLLLLAGAVVMMLALVINYPNDDDFQYVPDPVFHLQNPTDPMDFRLHFFATGQQPFDNSGLGASHYDYFRAVIAYYLNVEYLVVYHILSVAVMGFLIPLAQFLLVSHFSDDTTDALVGTFIATAILLVLINVGRTYGTFTIPRLYQGKSVVVIIGLPVLASFCIAYLISPTNYNWLMLLGISTTMVGMTVSAIPLVMMMMIVVGIGHLALSPARPFKRDTRIATVMTFAGYFTATGFVLLYAAYIAMVATVDVSAESSLNITFPTTFEGQAEIFLGNATSITALSLVISTALALILLSGNRRRFLMFWAGSLVALFLNPLVASAVMKYLTTTTIYWRVFFVYPFPIMASSVAAALSARARSAIIAPIRIGAAGLILIACVCYYVRFFNESGFVDWPRYKLSTQALDDARQVIASAPQGAMLAPHPLFGIIPMLDSRFPQVLTNYWLTPQLVPSDEVMRREYAQDVLSGKTGPVRRQALADLLKRGFIRSIVIKPEIYAKSVMRRFFDEERFTQSRVLENYVVLWRPQDEYMTTLTNKMPLP